MASALKSMQQAVDKEDDDDLAALRQAALMSRKSSTKEINGSQNIGTVKPVYQKNPYTYFNDKHHVTNFPPHRLGYNKPKWRNSNLIVINTVPLEEKSMVQNSVPKLLLPQDRWCPVDNSQVKTEVISPKGPKKFSRIRSNSDSESDYDDDSESEANSDIIDKNDTLDDTNASLEDEGGSLQLSEEEINFDNSQEANLASDPDAALLEDELNLPIIEPVDDIEDDVETPEDVDTVAQSVEIPEENDHQDHLPLEQDDNRPDSSMSNDGSVKSLEEGLSEADNDHDDETRKSDDDHDEETRKSDDDHDEETLKSDTDTGIQDEEEQDDDGGSLSDSDLGSCINIELEHPDYDAIEAQTVTEPIKKKPKVKITMKSSNKSKNAQDILTPSSKDVSKSPKSSEVLNDERKTGGGSKEKAPVDLRLLLKAKRRQKSSPDHESRDSSPDSPVVKSVLSVVKPLKKSKDLEDEDNKDRRKKKFDGTISVASGSGSKVRLLQLKADSARVTVVTDNDREEKKSSVHKRLGPYASASATAANTTRSSASLRTEERESNTRSRLSRTVVVSPNFSTKRGHSPSKKNRSVDQERNSRSSSESSSSSRHRSTSSSSSSKRVSYSSRRSRKGGHQSGLNNVKEIQLDAKIREIQAINAAILKRQEEIEADIKKYAN